MTDHSMDLYLSALANAIGTIVPVAK
jgi:hypothetical protein